MVANKNDNCNNKSFRLNPSIPQIENLDSDFGDGLKLVGLLQQLAGKSIGARVTKKPRIRAQKLENVKICFDFMNREGTF